MIYMRKTIIKCQSKFSDENLFGACPKQQKLYAHFSNNLVCVMVAAVWSIYNNVRYQKVQKIVLLLFTFNITNNAIGVEYGVFN